MELVRFLLRISPRLTLLTGAMSLLCGGFNGALVAVVHRALTDAATGPAVGLVFVFIAVVLGRLFTGAVSDVMLTTRAEKSVAKLSIDLVRKLERVPLQNFEHMGQARVLSSLTHDVGNLSLAFYEIPTFAVNVAMVLGGAGYLVYLSFRTLLILGAFTLVGTIVYRAAIRRAYRLFAMSGQEKDRLHGHFSALVHGMKELKLNRERRHLFTEVEVAGSADKHMTLDIRSHKWFVLSNTITHAFFLTLVGIVVFVLPEFHYISQVAVSGYVLTALFLMGPMNGAAAAFPLFSRAQVSLNRLKESGLSLDRQALEKQVGKSSKTQISFNEIVLKSAVCGYRMVNDRERFVLGPLDMTLRKGEIVFITGGNGSGKSTLAKVLSGLYALDEGTLCLDGVEITGENRDGYRQLFSAVFSDFFLFENLPGFEASKKDERARHFLEALSIEQKVRVKDGVFTTTRLSSGQRKRLALLNAYLEDRPVYLFDEWAADQEPSFKEIFYRRLIPELKESGKTVVVITHDDRWFDTADRLFKMQDGRLFEIADTQRRIAQGR